MSQSPTTSRLLYRRASFQYFLAALRKCHPELCIEHESGFYYTDHFDPHTRTLSVPRLECSSLTDEDLESFKVLEHVNGDLVIRDNTCLTSLEGLRNLQTVNGRFELSNAGFRELSCLTRLRRVGGLNIEQMPALQSICGFTSLALAGKELRISSNPRLKSITGFTPLLRIDQGSLVLTDNPVLETARGLTGLTSVRDTIFVSKCPRLSDFRFLSFLEYAGNIEVNETGFFDGSPLRTLFNKNPHFKGSIKFTRNPGLSDLSFMHGLTTVGSSLYLHQNSLVNTRGLEQLRRVGASFNLSANRLTDISQLSSLEEIEGILGLSYNRLSSLHGLENLRRIRTKKWGKELMSIKFNDNRHPDGRISLDDIGALSNVYETTGRMIVFADSDGGHTYRVKPGSDSIFFRRNANIVVHGKISATVLPLTHICGISSDKRVPMLFPDMSSSWQYSLRKCEGIVPHFFPFRDPDKVISYCNDNNVLLLFGIKVASQKFLAREGEVLRRHGLRFIANDLQTLNNCTNKVMFREFMEKNGFGQFIPVHYETRESVQYPCIVKPLYGSFGRGQRIVFSKDGLGKIGKEEVVCEYIAGHEEYASHIFYLERERYWHVTYRKRFDSPFFIQGQVKNGSFTIEKVETRYLNLFLDILENLRYRGICCIDYKMFDHAPKIFEINARTGYSLAETPEDFRKMLEQYSTHAI